MNSRLQPSALRRAVGSASLAAAVCLLLPQFVQAGGGPERFRDAPLHPAMAAWQGSQRGTDQLIVKYRTAQALRLGAAATAHRPAASAAMAQLGVQMKAQRTLSAQTQVLRLSRKLRLDEASDLARQLAADDPNIEYAEPDRILTIQATPTDPRYGEQWHYFEPTGGLNLPAAWDHSTGSGVVVAVLDTGFRPHADLRRNLIAGYDFVNDVFVANDGDGRDSDPSDPGDGVLAGECGGGQPIQDESSSWHGTHVAGTVAAAADGTGVVGVAYNAKIQPVRVLGRCGGYMSDIAEAVIWASGGSVSGVPANATPARVINLSLGGFGSCDQTMQDAVNSARSRRTVVVVAAGNSSSDARSFTPANCQGVVTVAATNRSGGRSYYSNYGSTVEVAAPGGETSSSRANGVLSTLNAGQRTPGADSFAFYQGTSMAAPHVAGVVALVLERNSNLSSDAVSTLLQNSARAFPAACSGCGRGIVDAAAAVAAASGGDGDPEEVTEVEPNDTTSQAQVIAISGSTVRGAMASDSDHDYYSVALGAGRTLTIGLTPNSTSDYDLYVYDAGSRLVGRSLRGRGLRDVLSVSGGSGGGTYYIEVRYYDGDTGDQGRYTIDASF
ncbi:S8 family peptidase [Aquabacterium sp. A7-Y]|uniref:S8 family peptidase n=1 Tax=Aquabacterium sp. A7-Y TaxID=1349605 RepID=UPI00223E2684|nr:S8 family peptidase [Aquabacterium sp. A7-Y]MCW7538322.1 S8 family peptidase [Aquabacterium sp. A7-Y]